MIDTKPVFDYVAGAPWVLTEETTLAMDDAASRGESPADAYKDEEVRQIRTNPRFRADVREVYDAAGVNLLSVTLGSNSQDLTYADGVWRDVARWDARFEALDWLHKVTTPDAARAVVERGEVGVVLNTQNLGKAIEGKMSRVDDLFNAGVRIMQLTYNRQNELGTGCTDRSGGGLSERGVDVVHRLNDLGAVVDLSHCGRETTLDAVSVSRDPIAYTHTSCQEVMAHPRAKSDEEIERLAEVDGYLGVYLVPPFAAPGRESPTLSVFFDHLDHAISIVGHERVGIGTDFAHVDARCPDPIQAEQLELMNQKGFREEHGATQFATGFGQMQTYTDWPVVRDGLAERYTAGQTRNVLGENFLSFWERVRE